MLVFRERQLSEMSVKSLPEDVHKYDAQIAKLTQQLEAIQGELIEKLAEIGTLEKEREEWEERGRKEAGGLVDERERMREETVGKDNHILTLQNELNLLKE